MASNASIFKATIQIADMDRHYYEDHALTLARHPSETDERMMVRLLAFILHAHEALSFGRRVSTEEEPALWHKDLTGAIVRWIEVGQPEEKTIRWIDFLPCPRYRLHHYLARASSRFVHH